jgi:hypothetical protein
MIYASLMKRFWISFASVALVLSGIILWTGKVPDVQSKYDFNDRGTTETAAKAISKIENIQVVYASHDSIYGVSERSVYKSYDGNNFIPIGYLPRERPESTGIVDKIKNSIGKNRIIRKFRRVPGPASLVVLSSGTIIVVSDQIYRKSKNGRKFEIVETNFDFKAPFNSGSSIAVGPDDEVYFGEYTTGKKPENIRIFKGEDDGKKWSLAYKFPGNLVYHVHSIVWDRFRQRYWITTGDSDEESHIFFTENKFKSLQRLGGGSQDWRAVGLIVREDDLVWGSDDGRNRSSIFSWNLIEGELRRLQDIGNPASYVGSLKDGTLLISTIYVPDTEFGRSGNAKPEAALWGSPSGERWVKLYSLPVISGSNDTKRPQIRLPGGDGTNDLAYISPINTEWHDFSTLQLEINWN